MVAWSKTLVHDPSSARTWTQWTPVRRRLRERAECFRALLLRAEDPIVTDPDLLLMIDLAPVTEKRNAMNDPSEWDFALAPARLR